MKYLLAIEKLAEIIEKCFPSHKFVQRIKKKLVLPIQVMKGCKRSAQSIQVRNIISKKKIKDEKKNKRRNRKRRMTRDNSSSERQKINTSTNLPNAIPNFVEIPGEEKTIPCYNEVVDLLAFMSCYPKKKLTKWIQKGTKKNNLVDRLKRRDDLNQNWTRLFPMAIHFQNFNKCITKAEEIQRIKFPGALLLAFRLAMLQGPLFSPNFLPDAMTLINCIYKMDKNDPFLFLTKYNDKYIEGFEQISKYLIDIFKYFDVKVGIMRSPCVYNKKITHKKIFNDSLYNLIKVFYNLVNLSISDFEKNEKEVIIRKNWKYYVLDTKKLKFYASEFEENENEKFYEIGGRDFRKIKDAFYDYVRDYALLPKNDRLITKEFILGVYLGKYVCFDKNKVDHLFKRKNRVFLKMPRCFFYAEAATIFNKIGAGKHLGFKILNAPDHEWTEKILTVLSTTCNSNVDIPFVQARQIRNGYLEENKIKAEIFDLVRRVNDMGIFTVDYPQICNSNIKPLIETNMSSKTSSVLDFLPGNDSPNSSNSMDHQKKLKKSQIDYPPGNILSNPHNPTNFPNGIGCVKCMCECTKQNSPSLLVPRFKALKIHNKKIKKRRKKKNSNRRTRNIPSIISKRTSNSRKNKKKLESEKMKKIKQDNFQIKSKIGSYSSIVKRVKGRARNRHISIFSIERNLTNIRLNENSSVFRSISKGSKQDKLVSVSLPRNNDQNNALQLNPQSFKAVSNSGSSFWLPEIDPEFGSHSTLNVKIMNGDGTNEAEHLLEFNLFNKFSEFSKPYKSPRNQEREEKMQEERSEKRKLKKKKSLSREKSSDSKTSGDGALFVPSSSEDELPK